MNNPNQLFREARARSGAAALRKQLDEAIAS
jgi:hypothetical protein